MRLDLWAEPGDRCGIQVRNFQYSVRVAHGYYTDFHRLSGGRQGVQGCAHSGFERDVLRFEARETHVHGNAFVILDDQFNTACRRLYRDAPGVGQTLVTHKAGKTARAVAALFHLAPVGVENPVAELRIVPLRAFHQQQLVKAYAQPSVGKLTDLGRAQVDGLVDGIDDHEVIAQAVHFAEGQFHSGRVRAGGQFASASRAYQNEGMTPEPAGQTRDVLRVQEIGLPGLESVLARYGLACERVDRAAPIPGSYWGDEEAGLIANRLLVRDDTPVHSLLHEAGHFVCMTPERRAGLHTDAGGDYAEENGVCYLQILLADQLPGLGRERMMRDMDAWGYSFRLGSARAWFEQDAEDAWQWLRDRNLVDASGQPTWQLRDGAL